MSFGGDGGDEAESDDQHTVVVKPKINNGIFKLTITITKFPTKTQEGYVGIGVASSAVSSDLADDIIGQVENSVNFAGNKNRGRIYCGGSFVTKLPAMNEGDQFSAEVDGSKHTVRFFHGGNQIPYVITNVPREVYFGFYGDGGSVVEYASLVQLRTPTVSATPLAGSVSNVKWK